ncbi:benzoate/H(+) symporter BenE family transporter [Nocardioides anomalus]|uniref:benzoate/H(+) symporter BenE family transporter n=1 Tax=Nocardioides anomalus TaxID=2712223 RepID=UPI001E57C578|nr:benzoate/H(+) symporter BenE family transporter [Nocardioides anomalus]
MVGWTSSFAVVLTGLRQVGASEAEAASGLLVVSVLMGLGSLLFSWRTRMPVTLAWSTPGAALLAGAARPDGGYAAAVGAFVVAALLYLLTALVRPLGHWVQQIPASLANAMLAGVLLTLCVEPFRALAADWTAVAPVLATWLVLTWLAPRYATPAAFVAAVVVITATGALGELGARDLVPQVTWTTPHADLAAAVAIGLPLYLVTMTSQNIPGVAVLASFGYRAPLRGVLAYAGLTGAATAGAGGYSVNLAAISAALSAGPPAGPDPQRRWVAGVSNGVTAVVLGVAASAVATVAVAAPEGVLETVAGVALLGTFGASAAAALADPDQREAAAVTFVVAASGFALGGVGAAFWSLVAGGLVLAVTRFRPGPRSA